jgi:hypothetical protein
MYFLPFFFSLAVCLHRGPEGGQVEAPAKGGLASDENLRKLKEIGDQVKRESKE